MTTDSDALLCDLAETYGIYSFEALPVATLAVLSSGLRGNSRIYQKMTGAKGARMEMLVAAAVDRLSLLLYSKTKDAQDGINPPRSILDQLFGEEQANNDSAESFEDPAEFHAAWAAITGGE